MEINKPNLIVEFSKIEKNVSLLLNVSVVFYCFLVSLNSRGIALDFHRSLLCLATACASSNFNDSYVVTQSYCYLRSSVVLFVNVIVLSPYTTEVLLFLQITNIFYNLI